VYDYYNESYMLYGEAEEVGHALKKCKNWGNNGVEWDRFDNQITLHAR